MKVTIPVEPDADQARQWAEDELAKPGYGNPSESWYEKVLSWLNDILDAMTGAGSRLNPVNTILILVIAAALIALVIWLIRGSVTRSHERDKGAGSMWDDERRTTAQIEAAARAAADAGNWDLAVVELYRATVLRTHERAIVSISDGMTAHEAADAIGAAVPEARLAVLGVAEDFNVARYGAGGLPHAAWMRALGTWEELDGVRHASKALT